MAISFPGPFPRQGKGPGNEIGYTMGNFFVQIGSTFNNFLTCYPYKLKFETLLDTFKIKNLVVLVVNILIFWRENDVKKWG